MDADLIIAEHYRSIIDSVNSGGVASLSENDRMIWYIVSARCEKDMEGFESIFVQFVSEPEVAYLVDSLGMIDEPELAMLFDRAYQTLQQAGFYDQGSSSYYQLGDSLRRQLKGIEDLIGDRLWGLDDKLVRLIEDNNLTRSQGD